jgi:hypothetical protein
MVKYQQEHSGQIVLKCPLCRSEFVKTEFLNTLIENGIIPV